MRALLARIYPGMGVRALWMSALATLCLEVYYRYLPLHVETAGEEKSLR